MGQIQSTRPAPPPAAELLDRFELTDAADRQAATGDVVGSTQRR